MSEDITSKVVRAFTSGENPWLCDCGAGRDSPVHLQGCARSSWEARQAKAAYADPYEWAEADSPRMMTIPLDVADAGDDHPSSEDRPMRKAIDEGISLDDFTKVERREQDIREKDIFMLRELLDAPDITDKESEAFVDMVLSLEKPGGFKTLTTKQRSWVEVAAEKYQTKTDPNPKPVPRGREVPTAKVLQNLPKKPPRRASS